MGSCQITKNGINLDLIKIIDCVKLYILCKLPQLWVDVWVGQWMGVVM